VGGDQVVDTREISQADADLTCLDSGRGSAVSRRTEVLTITASPANGERGGVLRQPRGCGAVGG
jgi:hypothetical protein